MAENDFSVLLNGTVIGIAKDAHEDWPWTRGTFVATPAFEAVKHLFDEEYRCLSEKRSPEHAAVRSYTLGTMLRLRIFCPGPSSSPPKGSFLCTLKTKQSSNQGGICVNPIPLSVVLNVVDVDLVLPDSRDASAGTWNGQIVV